MQNAFLAKAITLDGLATWAYTDAIDERLHGFTAASASQMNLDIRERSHENSFAVATSPNAWSFRSESSGRKFSGRDRQF